jgi:serine/threonine protein kinase
VDDEVIDNGLRIVRGLWDANLAHRDIKPANLMVRDGQVLIIDVFFAEVCRADRQRAVRRRAGLLDGGQQPPGARPATLTPAARVG